MSCDPRLEVVDDAAEVLLLEPGDSDRIEAGDAVEHDDRETRRKLTA